MAGTNTKTFTEAAFDADVLNAETPVLVDFWAEWCGPCRMLGPTIDAVADDFAGKAKIGKLNVDQEMGIAQRYNIRGIPALLLFKGGKVAGQLVGAVPKEEIAKLINSHL